MVHQHIVSALECHLACLNFIVRNNSALSGWWTSWCNCLSGSNFCNSQSLVSQFSRGLDCCGGDIFRFSGCRGEGSSFIVTISQDFTEGKLYFAVLVRLQRDLCVLSKALPVLCQPSISDLLEA